MIVFTVNQRKNICIAGLNRQADYITVDISHKDLMSVISRYVDQGGVVHEHLLDLKEVREKTGDGQATTILQSVGQNGLDSKNTAFELYDFMNSMLGKYNGAQAVVSLDGEAL